MNRGDFGVRNEVRGRPPKKFVDDELQVLWDEDEALTQQQLADQLHVTRQEVIIRLKAMGMIQKATWYQALINCKNAGMELASLHSEDERNMLQKFLQDNGYDKGYWLAGTKQGNGQYYWATTGNKVIYTNWLVGQPDDAKLDYNFNEGEDCIQLGMPTYSPVPNGWNDLGCQAELPYICQTFEYCLTSNGIM